MKVGDIVFVIDDNVPPLQLPLAKIQHDYIGPDKFVRVVKINTATGIYNRPVQKLKKIFDANFNDDFKWFCSLTLYFFTVPYFIALACSTLLLISSL